MPYGEPHEEDAGWRVGGTPQTKAWWCLNFSSRRLLYSPQHAHGWIVPATSVVTAAQRPPEEARHPPLKDMCLTFLCFASFFYEIPTQPDIPILVSVL